MKEPKVGMMWMRGFRFRFIKTIGCFGSGELVWTTHFVRNTRLKQRAIRPKTRRWKRKRKTEKVVDQFGSGAFFFYSSRLLHSGTDKPHIACFSLNSAARTEHCTSLCSQGFPSELWRIQFPRERVLLGQRWRPCSKGSPGSPETLCSCPQKNIFSHNLHEDCKEDLKISLRKCRNVDGRHKQDIH